MPRECASYKRENPDKGCENVGTKEQITDQAKTRGQRRVSVPTSFRVEARSSLAR